MLSNKVNLQQDERRWLLQQLHGQFVCDQTQDQSSGEGSESRMVTPGQHGVQAQTYCEKELGVRELSMGTGGEKGEEGKKKRKKLGGTERHWFLLIKYINVFSIFPAHTEVWQPWLWISLTFLDHLHSMEEDGHGALFPHFAEHQSWNL